jgi:SWI/SNF-related matrix-associated actin-dependent regulator 1 of chromatin subfamily A
MFNRMNLEYKGGNIIAQYKFSKKYNQVLAKFGGRFSGTDHWIAPKASIRLICREMRVKKYYLKLSKEIQEEFNVDEEGYSSVERAKREKKRLSHMSNATDKKDYDEESLEMPYPLLPYQRAGLHYAELKKGRILLGDDMGLGKTIQAIGISKIYKSDWPVVVVAPASLLLNWRKEFLTWLPKDLVEDDVVVMRKGKDLPKGKIVICSFDYANKRNEELTQFLSVKGILLVDEAQNIKNKEAIRTKAVTNLSHFAKRSILMTGTPILNRVEEIYSLLNAIDPLTWWDYYSFVFKYCDASKSKFGLYVGGASNVEELHDTIREQMMCRRLKGDVLKQLPSKRRTTLTLDANKNLISRTNEIMEHYIKIIVNALHKTHNDLNKAKSLILSETSIDVSEGLFEAYKLTGEAKIEPLCDWIHDKLENGMEKLIIFGHHGDFLNGLQAKIEEINEKIQEKNKKVEAKIKKAKTEEKKAEISDSLVDEIGFMRIDGKTSKDKRFKNQEEFQTDPKCKVALLSINAANSGLTLTASSTVIMGELPWTPGVSRQAEDRVHRIGQENPVTIYYTIAEDTFDGSLWGMLQNKSKIASKLLDDGHGDEMLEDIDISSGDLLSCLIYDTSNRIKDGSIDIQQYLDKEDKDKK